MPFKIDECAMRGELNQVVIIEDTHTCGGGCCSYGGKTEDEKDVAIGLEKEEVDELLLAIMA